ncbi:hypothetical protein ANN_16833 [Periplaneta americana]|uniref:Uncharacterized protein n=1 Tax=Periplaneta americana TaxID=6978 RepID=A0ABQ8SSG7_PERAM|nr:hypothetical protein ANN_16833 [Periplaneta americana]
MPCPSQMSGFNVPNYVRCAIGDGLHYTRTETKLLWKFVVMPQGNSSSRRKARACPRIEPGSSVLATRPPWSSENITQKALITKWKWGGHVARQQQGRRARETTMWDPYIGRRTQGRPRRRWADTFKQQLGGNWSTIARNRTSGDR